MKAKAFSSRNSPFNLTKSDGETQVDDKATRFGSANFKVANDRRTAREQRRQRQARRIERRISQGKGDVNANINTLRGLGVLRARLAKPCSYCHFPYHHRLAPFSNMKLAPCLLCGKKWVPEVILSTIEPPSRLPIRGSGVLIEARVCRVRMKANGENDALSVSEALPFLEYELMRQLMLKLKVLARNAAFSLKSEVDVGSRLIVATATATAVYCEAMPPPRILEISRTIDVRDAEDLQLVKLQRQIEVRLG